MKLWNPTSQTSLLLPSASAVIEKVSRYYGDKIKPHETFSREKGKFHTLCFSLQIVWNNTWNITSSSFILVDELQVSYNNFFDTLFIVI